MRLTKNIPLFFIVLTVFVAYTLILLVSGMPNRNGVPLSFISIYYLAIVLITTLPIAFYYSRKNQFLLKAFSVFLVVDLLYLVSPIEVYSRGVNLFLFFLAYLAYLGFSQYLIGLFLTKWIKILIAVIFYSPVILVTLFLSFNLLFPIAAIMLSDRVMVDERIKLDNTYFIEKIAWGWAANSGDEARLYKVLIPSILKHKVEVWKGEYIKIDADRWADEKCLIIYLDSNSIKFKID